MGVNERNRRWNRLLINFFWMTLIFDVLVVSVNMNIKDTGTISYVVQKIALPTLVFSAIVLFFEWSYKWKEKINDYLLITGTIIILATLMWAYASSISVIIILFVFPIFLAVFTMKKVLITFAFLSVLAIFWCFELFCTHFEYFITEQITFIFILIASYLLGIVMVNHFNALNNELLVSVKNEKELLYKKIYMERLAKMDLATNLYNHKTFHEYLEKLMEQFIKRAFPLHIALLDLDDFKQVNDHYGHAIGDCVIEKTAKIILDNIGEHDLASRYGGEEFGIIFIEKTQEECLYILEKIRASIETLRFDSMIDTSITISIGLATENATMNKEQLFKKADKYLYQSKTNGKNQINFETIDLTDG